MFKQQGLQQQMQFANDSPPQDTPDSRKKEIQDLVKNGKVSPDTLALLNAISALAGYNNQDLLLEKKDYEKIKKLDNKVFDNADLYIGEGSFTIIDKKSGKAFSFDVALDVYDLETYLKEKGHTKQNIQKSIKENEIESVESDRTLLAEIVKGYIADGGLSKKDIEQISKADEIIESANVVIGNEKITTVSFDGATSSVNNPNSKKSPKVRK